MTAALQTTLRLPKVAVPMLTIEGAMSELQCERAALMELIEGGTLLGALDVSAGAGELCDLRIPRRCLEECLAGATVARSHEDLAELVFGAFARQSGRIRRNTARQRLLVSAQTMGELTRLPAPRGLALESGSRWRPGPNGSPTVPWAELVRFITIRRLDTGKTNQPQTQQPS